MVVLLDIYSFGNGIFLNEMIEIIGVKNVLVNEKGWLLVIEEVVIVVKLEVILINVNYMKDFVKEILVCKNWESVLVV